MGVAGFEAWAVLAEGWGTDVEAQAARRRVSAKDSLVRLKVPSP